MKRFFHEGRQKQGEASQGLPQIPTWSPLGGCDESFLSAATNCERPNVKQRKNMFNIDADLL